MDAADGVTTSFGGYRFRYRLQPRVAAGSDQACSADSIELEGRRLPPVVFLSAAFQSMDSWKGFERRFRPVADVLLVDLPGTGRADPLPSTHGLDFLADALCAVLDECGLERVGLIAASYGSPVAYRFAQRHPDRVSHLVLAGIMGEIPAHRRAEVERSVELAMSGDTDALAALGVDALLCRDPARRVARRRLAERILACGLRRMGPEDRLRFALNSRRLLDHEPLDVERPPRARCLVFTGEHDDFTTPAACRSVAERIAGAWFTTIREADHLFRVERFDVTADLLLRFLRGRLLRPHAGWYPPQQVGRAQPARAPVRVRERVATLP